ncbi:hypothetical protein [Kitasatospora sp. GAS204B]|nr:hypothetical protein [Kitasatospora sp. GAS204B]MDH6121796.1 hypothetical protein [Kitasatospora sp. GAS204B]
MVDVDAAPFEVEVRGRGPCPIVLGASPHQKALRHLPLRLE